jgi:hypothetical protein
LNAKADDIDSFFSMLKPNIANEYEVADGVAWQALKKDSLNPDRLKAIFNLAGNDKHYDAQNYAGCLLANGYLVKQDKSRALRYFSSALAEKPLALYNWGVTKLSLNSKDAAGYKAVTDSFAKAKFREAGELILLYQLNNKNIDEKHLDLMYGAKSPLAYYIKAARLYQQGRYLDSLNIAMVPAEFGEINSVLLVSKDHEALSATDRSNEKQAMKWGYIYRFYKDNMDEALAGSINHPYINDLDQDAWREALAYVKYNKRQIPDYFKAVCEPKFLIGT